MQDAQDTHGVADDAIGRNVRRAADNQFARAFDSAGASCLGKVEQSASLIPDSFINKHCGKRAARFEVVEDFAAVIERKR